jgi:hypothetical protein
MRSTPSRGLVTARLTSMVMGAEWSEVAARDRDDPTSSWGFWARSDDRPTGQMASDSGRLSPRRPRTAMIAAASTTIPAIIERRPDLLGVCEVENRLVVDRLMDAVNATLPVPRNYAVVHADTDDARGIDVAFSYDNTLLQVPLPLEGSVFFQVVMRRHATHEIVQSRRQLTTRSA